MKLIEWDMLRPPLLAQAGETRFVVPMRHAT